MRRKRQQEVLELLLTTDLTPYKIAKQLGMKYVSQIYPVINSLKAKGLYDEEQRPIPKTDEQHRPVLRTN